MRLWNSKKQLQELFAQEGFVLRKWKTSVPAALKHVSPHLLDEQATYEIVHNNNFVKVLGIEWNAELDCFRPMIGSLSPVEMLTKQTLVSDITRMYDVLGWCLLSIIKPKILLQRLWEDKFDWDELVSTNTREVWQRWWNELAILCDHQIPRCYFPKEANTTSIQLHGFSDASELVYAGAVYLRVNDSNYDVHISLAMAKTRVAPIKRLTIPRLELCGANFLAHMLHHISNTLNITPEDIHAWIDSLLVLRHLRGNPRQFKTFVNWVSDIIELVLPCCWHYVDGSSNSADWASRGLFPKELIQHNEWWNGPKWLYENESHWPSEPVLMEHPEPTDERELHQEIVLTLTQSELPLLRQVCSYTRLKRATAWLFRFVNNCRSIDLPEALWQVWNCSWPRTIGLVVSKGWHSQRRFCHWRRKGEYL